MPLPPTIMTPPVACIVTERYLAGESSSSIGRDPGIKVPTICDFLRRRGIKLRDTNRHYAVNDRYFETIDHQDKAYWLGFLAADGTIGGNNAWRPLAAKESPATRQDV